MKKWFLKRLPLALILVVIWSVVRLRLAIENFSQFNLTGLIFVFACVIVLVIEFYKSGDINLKAFGWDLALSVVATIICTVTITWIVAHHKGAHFTDGMICLLILFDAWVSPFNSYRTALRNWTANVGTSPSDAP
ncbi:MAG: hypothetical protein WC438_02850 [Candidatus Pacearchaeota archaeon]